jgi:NADH dehydrogenase (ubiquinone) 1 alpha subcomplex subunit 9
MIRNTMFETLLLLRGRSNTVIQFTTSSDENLKQSIPLHSLSVDDRNFKFNDVHVTAAQQIAEAAAKHNVSRLIHVSSYNADPTSESQFYASKVFTIKTLLTCQGLGELAVREAFPSATIVRPPPMFGVEDRLLNALAAPRFYWHTASLEKPTMRPAYVCLW